MKNKRGQMLIIFGVFIFLAIILVLAFVFSLTTGIVHYVSNEVTPVASDLGMIGDVNLSQPAQLVFGTVNTLTGIAPMLVGVAYFIFLIGCVGLCILYRGTANVFFIGLYVMFLLLMVGVAILISNVYQDVYTGTDVLALELQSQTILSFLILYSPHLFAVIGFICGIFLFTGEPKMQTDYSGGYS